MSIRVKILMVLVLGMLVALTVSALAFFNAQRLDRAIERIVSQDLAALRAVSQAREALRDAQRTENLMIAWREPSLKGDVDRSVTELEASVEAGQALAPDVETSDLFQQVREHGEAYADAIESLVRVLRDTALSIETHRDALHSELASMRDTLRELEKTIRAMPTIEEPAAPGPVTGRAQPLALPSELKQKLLGQVSRVRGAVDRLDELDASVPEFETANAQQLEERVTRRLEDLDSQLDALLDLLTGTRFANTGVLLASNLDTASRESHALSGAVAKQVDSIVDLRNETQTLRSDIEANFAALTKVFWKAVERRREEISDQRTLAISIIFSILIGGGALVVLLGVVLMRGTARSFEVLLEAAESIQQGDLDTRVRISGRDELQRLGDAFNAMARYLTDRRQQQSDYNEIVTLLNSTLGADEILAGSLNEIVTRSSSDVGAFYAADENGEELHLAKGFGLSDEMAERTSYKLGAGLVGQAAKTRRKILVSPVPEGAFSIDIGVGHVRPAAVLILPVVHVDSLLGVFVLVSVRPYPDDVLTFIEEVVFQFGVAYNNARFVATIEQTALALRERTEELIRQRARLEKVNRELEDANRLKSDFLANITHELRTPLNSIIGFSELVLDRDDLSEKPRRHLNTVLRNARNLLGLINDLLDITKIESGKIALRPGPVDLPSLIDNCLQTISPLVDRDRVDLESRIEPGLTEMHTDAGKLSQVLINLLSNAAKFTEEGAIRVDARELDDERIEFAVLDTGIGIHSEDLPLIFDKFRQVDGSASRKYGGTGLGLAITSELVHMLGGEITAKSEPGAGSTFIVVLPKILDADAAEPRAGGVSHGGAMVSPTSADAPDDGGPMRQTRTTEVGWHGPTSEPTGTMSGSGSLPSVPTVAAHTHTRDDDEDEADVGNGDAQPSGRNRKRFKTDVLEAVPVPSRRASAPGGATDGASEGGDGTSSDPARTRGPIIVLDDKPTAVVRLREHLVNDGFEFRSAFVCGDALSLMDDAEPSALVLGQPLPEDEQETRYETIVRRVRETSLPVLVLKDAVERARAAGLEPDGVLERPVDPDRVLTLLQDT